MSVLRDAASHILKMFAGDAVVTKGVLLAVSVAGLLTRYAIVQPLVAGGLLLFGVVAVLAVSVLIAARPRRPFT